MKKVAKVANEDIKVAKVGGYFCCEICDYKTSKKYNLTKHKTTKKHKTEVAKSSNINPFKCEKCEKVYKHKRGLWSHNRKGKCASSKYPQCPQNVLICPQIEMSKMKCPEIEMSKKLAKRKEHENKELVKIIGTLVKQNQTLMNQLTKNVSNNSNNTNKSHNVNSLNTQNNNLTVNVYLNEHCKDAMNIKDFVEKVKISLDDLQYTTDNGFAEGISNIFMKQLNDMKPTERPIHCADAKRCKFYVKDENNDWKKDTENKKINQSISDITVKQIRMLKVWESTHPYWNSNTVVGLKRQEIICQIMGGRDMDAQNKNRKKIKQMIGETIKLKDAMAQVPFENSNYIMNENMGGSLNELSYEKY
jgi:hypothetical protein